MVEGGARLSEVVRVGGARAPGLEDEVTLVAQQHRAGQLVRQ
jgi:hypothetical protein